MATKIVFGGLAAAFGTISTDALAADDGQVWTAATATIPAGDKVLIWLEGQSRFSNNAGRLGQALFRPAIGVKMDATTTVFAGYAFILTRPEGQAVTREHRAWQQVSFRLAGNATGPSLTGRTRFEQRRFKGSKDLGLRFRQMMRLTVPVRAGLQAVGSTEVFVGINDTSWGQNSGLDRVRSFAGVSIPASKTLRIEPGYLNEYVRRTGSDRMNHTASITLNAAF